MDSEEKDDVVVQQPLTSALKDNNVGRPSNISTMDRRSISGMEEDDQ